MTGGLVNTGNTCYINTIIQCLGHCPILLRYILESCSNVEDNTFATNFYEVLKELWINQNSIIPRKFLRFLKANIRSIDIYEQNDIHEFCTIFIDKLNQSVCKSITVTKTDLIKKYNYSNSDMDIQRFKMDVSWYEKTGKEYSPLVPMFYGQTISQIICGHCDKIFHNYEIYSNFLLPITETTNNLYDCFDEYFQEEWINTEDPIWTCDECKHKDKSCKTSKVWRFPHILMISLKRFTFDLQKNNKPIKIPELLNLSKYKLDLTEAALHGSQSSAQSSAQSSNSSSTYQLQAVAHHHGSSDSGHYNAICKKENKWYYCDDITIKEIENPIHEYGYVYFYTLI